MIKQAIADHIEQNQRAVHGNNVIVLTYDQDAAVWTAEADTEDLSIILEDADIHELIDRVLMEMKNS